MKMFNHEAEKLINESNAIEGIHREYTGPELTAFQEFLDLTEIKIADMVTFVSTFEPTARLRVVPGMDVYIGNHTPPPGGQAILYKLKVLLEKANDLDFTAWEVHMEYESLHPFSDGNGRSGRMLWTWMMQRRGSMWPQQLGFLHSFYYQTLSSK